MTDPVPPPAELVAFEEHLPPASPAELVACAEALEALGRPLPDAYRALLGACDGGDPVRPYFTLPVHGRAFVGVLRWLHGVRDEPGEGLAALARRTDGDLPPGVLAVGSDPGGNHVCLDLADGTVRFRDHEATEGVPAAAAELPRLADDLATFLAGLSTDPHPH